MSQLTLDEKGVVAACPHCGQKNRTPYARLAETGTCGRCESRLETPASPVEVRQTTQFDALISESSLPVVIDFWAPWCGPCKAVAPELVKVAASNAGRWLVVKVNTDALPVLGQRYGIQSIPTMAVFKAGREIGRTAGARPASAIEAFVRQTIDAA